MRTGFINRPGITYKALALDRFFAEDINAIASIINATSGSNTGDETLATIKSKLGITVLSGDNTGDETVTTIKSKLGISTLSGSNTGDETLATIKSKLGISTLSGSNTGDETLATIKSKLGISTLSGSNTGDETLATIKSKLGITVLSGSNTGDETLATIKSKLGAANTGSDGYLTATNWNTFNNKLSSQWVTAGSNISYSAGNVSVVGTIYGTRFSILGSSAGTSYLTFGDETTQIKSCIAYSPAYGQFTFNADNTDLFVLNSGAITAEFKKSATSLYVDYTSGSSLDFTYETSAERYGANSGTWYEGGNANLNWIWRSNGYGYRMTLNNVGDLRTYGTIRATGYVANSGQAGITNNIMIGSDVAMFENGLLVYFGIPFP